MAVSTALTCAAFGAAPARASSRPPAGPRIALTGAQLWHSCVPRAIGYRGMYRIGNDIFAGRRGRLCITSTGDNLTTDTNVPAQPGGVVSAPYIRVGGWYGVNDPGSPFPLPVLGRTGIVDHVSASCRAPGEWLVDTDTYLYRHKDGASGPPNIELVIGNCWRNIGLGHARRLRIGDRAWLVSSWVTCPGVIPCHRIIVFRAAHQTDSVRERITTFVWRAHRLHWIPRGTWIGNTAYQLETWSGGRGMRLAMTVSFPGLPVSG